jgi:hypothetical protein
MAENWTSAATAGGYAMPPARAMYELRPRSLGELLDATFSVYRANFWLFAGLGSVAAALQALLGAVQLLPMHFARHTATMGTPSPQDIASAMSLLKLGGGMLLAVGVLMIAYLLVFVVTQAATVFAVGEVCLGKSTTITGSLQATMGRWYRYLGIGFWQAGSMLWLPLLVAGGGGLLFLTKNTALMVVGGVLVFLGIAAGIPVGFIFYLRNALGVQATVIEGATVRAAMRRSKVLSLGAKGRIFVLLLLAGALNYVASLLQLPLLLFVTFTMAKGGQAVGSEVSMLVVSFLAHAVVQPVAMIGLSLIYFDQRVRKEGLDVELMLQATPAPGMPVAVEGAESFGGSV